MALTEDDVTDAAVTILDAYGLADLTMRRLGDALGVRAGALYHHVPNKQMLLARVADHLIAEVTQPTGEWRSALSAWASSLRGVLLAHRDSAEVVGSSRAMGLTALDAVAPASTVLAAVLPTREASAAASTLFHFVLGHVTEEQARADWERFGKPDPANPPTATADSFAVGVEILLDGIAARLR